MAATLPAVSTSMVGSTVVERQQIDAGDRRDADERHDEGDRRQGLGDAVEQRNEEAATEAKQEDVQRLEKRFYHFDSVSASIERVFLASYTRMAKASMTAVTEKPMTIAVTTSAAGMGSTARAVASEMPSALSMIGAVRPVT